MAVSNEQKMEAQVLYDAILRASNRFLHNCKHFSIEVLQMERPTYAEVAELMRKISVIVTLLADDFDPMMGQKAFEYCDLMRRMGVAIQEGNQVELKRLVGELDRRPGV